LTRDQVESKTMTLAESEANSQQQAHLLQSSITQLQQQLGALQSDLVASQAEAYSASCALSESRASAGALRSEISQLNERIAAASAHAAGDCFFFFLHAATRAALMLAT
jgi:septal ring factor EnvC (AmiA/AmiB activator)